MGVDTHFELPLMLSFTTPLSIIYSSKYVLVAVFSSLDFFSRTSLLCMMGCLSNLLTATHVQTKMCEQTPHMAPLTRWETEPIDTPFLGLSGPDPFYRASQSTSPKDGDPVVHTGDQLSPCPIYSSCLPLMVLRIPSQNELPAQKP